ncbi:YqaJ viral recombinase family protein [Nocardioides sp. SOB77]|uniref:YqaJ viral recombinase family protein n=1 Tax=Nocardioides oceani TaxID=3058369 RepID=A0ABT8FHU4_9ACTN|nr:YqaJ viral recombinase family protein [Nocardioides oceani]MDN4173957.1 YqaJ viral recombinase family protein [Nocardioides oceani]
MSAVAHDEALQPGSPGWLRLMTASKVAAILGASPWDSPRSMWHKMRNELPEEPQTAVQSRGHYLEPAVLQWYADEHGIDTADQNQWRVHPLYVKDGWAAATPDAVAFPAAAPRLVEAKSARELEEWGAPGTDEIPTYYLFQAYWQMHVSGIHVTDVPIIGAFLDFALYRVTYDPEVGTELEQRCRAFMDSVAADRPPALDGTTATYDALRKLYRAIDDSAVEIPTATAREYLEALAARKDAETRERQAKSTVLDLMGETRFATCGGIKVARRQPNRTGFQLNQVAKSTADLPLEGDPS